MKSGREGRFLTRRREISNGPGGYVLAANARRVQMSKCRYAHPLSSLTSLILFTAMASPLHGEALPGKCRLVPVNGHCKAMIAKYYFDQKTGRCLEYIYDGCGPVVPFDTLDECRALCESVELKTKQDETPDKKPEGKSRSGLAHDPVEDDPRYADTFEKIDDEVKDLLADHPLRGSHGFVNIYWDTKKQLLKKKYGIDWRSPGELNPQVLFD